MDDDYFDFAEHEELEEELDFDNPIECPHCKNMVPKGSLLCLYCGESLSKGKSPSWIKIVSVILIFIFVLFLILHL